MEKPPHTSDGFFVWWNRTPLYQRIIGALVLGIIVGVALGAHKTDARVAMVLAELKIFSNLVLRLLGALAPALILFVIIQALLGAEFERGTAPRLIRLLLLNTLVAILIGLFVATVLRPGDHAKLVTSAEKKIVNTDVFSSLLENVPRSLLGPLGDNGKVIGVIFIAVAFGIALRGHEKKAAVLSWVNVGVDVLITILHWIIALVPLAVFGLVAGIVGAQGFGAFKALGAFVGAVLLALLLQAVYYLARVRLASWVNPFALVKHCRDALVMAFSTGSSTATMPVTFECLKDKVGLREKSASLGALLGANFNNDGTALYEAMAALFIAQLTGVELTLTQQFLVVITSVVASVGAAGIPEAGLVTMTMVFHSVGLDPALIIFLLPVDWFLDRCRTAVNVMGDMNVSCLLDGKTREEKGISLMPGPMPN